LKMQIKLQHITALAQTCHMLESISALAFGVKACIWACSTGHACSVQCEMVGVLTSKCTPKGAA